MVGAACGCGGFVLRRAGEAQGFVLRAFLMFTVMSTFVVVPARAAEPACVDTQPTAVAAAEMASRCGRRWRSLISVRRTRRRSPSRKAASPTSSRREARRARKADGSWATVDTTLRVSGTTVMPVAAVLPVEFSAGGTGPAARLRDADRELSITWPLGPLPVPSLTGASVTYAEVLPGVDLKLTASVRGFSQTLVVKSREAAQNPKIAKVRFGFAAKGVAPHPAGGGLEAKDSSGRVVFASPTPMMWDSGGGGTTGVAAKSASAEPPKQRTATMPVTVENGEISVVPDTAMLADTATRYPVMIDPSWTGRVLDNAWTMVSSKVGHENSAFWQGRNSQGQGQDYLGDAGNNGNAGTGRICDDVSSDGRCLSTTYQQFAGRPDQKRTVRAGTGNAD